MPTKPDFSQIVGSHPIVYITVVGHSITDATQSCIVTGVVKSVEGDFSAQTRSDSRQEPYTDAQPIKITVVAWQDDYTALKRAILFSQALVNVTFQFGEDYYNFVDPYSLGIGIKFDVSENDISLTWEFSGKLTPVQWDAMLAEATGIISGPVGTGPTIAGMPARGVFNDGEYGVPNFLVPAVYVGTGDLATDDTVGLVDGGGTKFSLALTGKNKTTLGQQITKRAEFKNTINAFQNLATNVEDFSQWRNSEKVITWQFGNGTTIVLNKVTKIASGPKFNQDDGMIDMKNEGGVFLDAVNATAANITYNDGTQTITFNPQGKIFA